MHTKGKRERERLENHGFGCGCSSLLIFESSFTKPEGRNPNHATYLYRGSVPIWAEPDCKVTNVVFGPFSEFIGPQFEVGPTLRVGSS